MAQTHEDVVRAFTGQGAYDPDEDTDLDQLSTACAAMVDDHDRLVLANQALAESLSAMVAIVHDLDSSNWFTTGGETPNQSAVSEANCSLSHHTYPAHNVNKPGRTTEWLL